MTERRPVSVHDATEAAARIAGVAVRTPLLRLDLGFKSDIYLKLENLQPIGSFKIRGAASKLLAMPADTHAQGVWTASAGNMAQGAAYCARLLGVPFTAVVPESAPEAKIDAIERLGGRIEKISREQFFEIFSTREYPGMSGTFVHAFSDQDVMAGNATIALELVEELPDIRAVYVPYGGGGLSCGIAAVIRELSPGTEVIACEPDTAAPLAPSLAAGQPTTVDFTPSFVDGAGSPHVFPEMFALARTLIARSVPVSTPATAAAIRLLAERIHVIAEGAGALPVAAALSEALDGPVVCVVSGGNLNPAALAEILKGGVPGP